MQVMTGALVLWGVRSSTLPPPGQFSTSATFVKEFRSSVLKTRDLNFQGLQAHHPGWGRRYDQWCSKCLKEDHWKIHWECQVLVKLSQHKVTITSTGSVWSATTWVKSSQPYRADVPGKVFNICGPNLVSRFRFGPLGKEQILPRLEHVCKEEKVGDIPQLCTAYAWVRSRNIRGPRSLALVLKMPQNFEDIPV